MLPLTGVAFASVSLSVTAPSRLHEMLDLYLRAMRKCGCGYYSPTEIEAWLSGRTPDGYIKGESIGERYILATDRDHDLIGFAAWMPERLTGLYVAPELQGLGIGRSMFRLCQDAAAEVNAPIRQVRASLNAISFYEQLGFYVVRKGKMLRDDVSIPVADMELEKTPCSP